MKLYALVLLLVTGNAFAKCKVYGISDSPQRVSCQFTGLEVEISCKKNTYYMNNEKVENAFHFEVEEGAVPLAFKTNSGKMLVVIPDESMLAEYSDGKAHYEGKCSL